MKITDVKTYMLRVNVEEPFTSSRGWWYTTKNALLVEVNTDEGITGWGECYGPAAVGKAVIDSQLKSQVIGKDPFDVEVIWEHLYNRIKDYGMSGMTISGISGIDIALWDIIGQACNKPVHKLIGGCFRDKIEAYATGFYFKKLDRVNEEAVEEALVYASQGFQSMKMKIGLGSMKKDLYRIEQVKKAIGDDIKLMVDANHCYTKSAAKILGQELGRMGIYWFEEPISPEDLDGYAELTAQLDVPIAGGENEFTRYPFREIIKRKAMDIVQPDVCAAGGITECKKIAALAYADWIQCVPHAWGSIIGLTATIHFIASLPDCPPCLVPVAPMLEFEQTFNPFRDQLSEEPLVHEKGIVKVPEKPGLGLTIDRKLIEKYLVK
jgi:D-galactarolactone cycloisomerase